MPKKSFLPWLLIFGSIALITALIAPALRKPSRGPSFAVQREAQRKVIRERVATAGGWIVLIQECEQLLTSNSSSFRWSPPQHAIVTHFQDSGPPIKYETNIDYGPLPTAIAILQPQEIRAFTLEGQPPIIRMKFFGAHRTGGPSVPYYGIWIVMGTTSNDFTPEIDLGGTIVTGKIEKITNSVFEVY